MSLYSILIHKFRSRKIPTIKKNGRLMLIGFFHIRTFHYLKIQVIGVKSLQTETEVFQCCFAIKKMSLNQISKHSEFSSLNPLFFTLILFESIMLICPKETTPFSSNNSSTTGSSREIFNPLPTPEKVNTIPSSTF